MRLKDVIRFPHRIQNWETLNNLARTMTQMGAIDEQHAVPAKTILPMLPGSDKNGYRILRETPGFAEVWHERFKFYYYEAEEMGRRFAQDLGSDFYPKTFRNAMVIRANRPDDGEPITEIDPDGSLFRIKPYDASLRVVLNEMTAAFEVRDKERFIAELRHLISAGLYKLQQAQELANYDDPEN